MKFLKFIMSILVATLLALLVMFVFSKQLGLDNVKLRIIDNYFPTSQFVKLEKSFENDKYWNSQKDEYLKEINFARYAAYKKKLDVYMQHQLPNNKLQKSTLKEIDKKGLILDGNLKVIGKVKNLFPIKFNNSIYNLAKSYAMSGAVDTPNLVHSPNNPDFSGSSASENNPVFKKWYISDYIHVKKESIANGYRSVSEVVKGWINEDDNIETSKDSVLGHRLHILDTDHDTNFGGISKSKGSGWVYQSGSVKNSSYKQVNFCDFINNDKLHFTKQVKDSNIITSYFPIIGNELIYNKYLCNGINIKAFYIDDLNKEIPYGSYLDSERKYVVFKQEPEEGYVIRNSDEIPLYKIKIWGN